jgi:hypothetical protein
MIETWKDIPELGGKYQCSSLGRIRRINKDPRCLKEKYLKLQNTKDGYISVNPTVWYRKRVHRIVAELFLENPNKYKFVNHKDFNKKNNAVSNLEWVTASQNSQHANDAGRIGRMAWTVIDLNNGITYKSVKEVAKKLGIDYKYFHAKIKKTGKYGGYKLHEKTYKNIF